MSLAHPAPPLHPAAPADPRAATEYTPDAGGGAAPAAAGPAVDEPVRAAVEAATRHPWQVGQAAAAVDLVFVGAITPLTPDTLEVELRLRLCGSNGSTVWLRLVVPVHEHRDGPSRATHQ